MHLSSLHDIQMEAIMTMFTNSINYMGNLIPKAQMPTNLDISLASPQLSSISIVNSQSIPQHFLDTFFKIYQSSFLL